MEIILVGPFVLQKLPALCDGFFFKSFVYNFIVEQSNFLHWYNSFSKALAFTSSGLHAPHQTV